MREALGLFIGLTSDEKLSRCLVYQVDPRVVDKHKQAAPLSQMLTEVVWTKLSLCTCPVLFRGHKTERLGHLTHCQWSPSSHDDLQDELHFLMLFWCNPSQYLLVSVLYRGRHRLDGFFVWSEAALQSLPDVINGQMESKVRAVLHRQQSLLQPRRRSLAKAELFRQLYHPYFDHKVAFRKDPVVLLLAPQAYSRQRRRYLLKLSLDVVIRPARDDELEPRLVRALRCGVLVETSKLCDQVASISVSALVKSI